jgi:HD-like signal output (HDOD) protein/CheY-like chemotaxis protein
MNASSLLTPTPAPATTKKRILFVDDEAPILELFELMFKPMAEEWEMHFARSGPEALGQMEQQDFEVIVSDMRMPGMSGAEVLTVVIHRYPRTARLILSGYADHEAVAKCVGAAHQYLTKPCDVMTLKTTLARVCALDVFLKSEHLKSLVAQMSVLPSLPSLYFRVLEELQSPNSSIERIGELIALDPAMTAKLLQLVNSAFFGVRRKISNPAEATQLLGVGTVRALALSIHAFSCLDQNKFAEFSFERLWHHSLVTGLIAKKITELETPIAAAVEESFIAGLLHDLGKSMLLTNMADDYRKALALAGDRQIALWEAEQIVFGATHADVGGYLLGLWGLPAPIVEAVALHHHPAKGATRAFCALTAVHMANALEHERSSANDGLASARIDDSYLAELNFAGRLSAWRCMLAEIAPQVASVQS